MSRCYILNALLLFFLMTSIGGQERYLIELKVSETAGLARVDEYLEIDFQSRLNIFKTDDRGLIAKDLVMGKEIPCQVIERYRHDSHTLYSIIFPLSIEAHEKKRVIVQSIDRPQPIQTDLFESGSGLDLMIENQFYRADLSRSMQSEAKSHSSGQLRELLIKMDFHQWLFRTENRMHWAPNFQRTEAESYQTIADWEMPTDYQHFSGPYLIETIRSDSARKHPEIWLTAQYKFYAQKPYFLFYSLMEVEKDITLKLLRNDEITMDSMFTNVAFQRPDGRIEDYKFSERYPYLEQNPIENEAPWLCFYHRDKGYGIASIRLNYDITNRYGNPSPTYYPHTKISDGAEGGKYWNRRLIDDHPLLVPAGSRYAEKNAYLVFAIKKDDPFAEINYWAERLQKPLNIKIITYF